MTYTLGTVNGRGIRSVNYIYTDSGVTLTVTLTDDTTTEFTIPKGDTGEKGDTGVSITGVELVSRTGLTDLYVIRFSDGTTTNFSVTNGRDAVIDSSMDSSSTNALENRVITNELAGIHSDLDTKFNEKDILQLLYDYGHVSDGTVSRITLVSDKDILSYVDGDVATLTATVYDNSDNPVSNQIVVFYKNGKVLDTGVTDANGEATYEYESEGAGDITFGASVGSLFIETYGIYDYDWSGTNVSVSKNDDVITLTNTIRGAPQCILHELYGEAPSFVFEFDSFASGNVTDGEQIGLVVKSESSSSLLTGIYTNQSSQVIWFNYSSSSSYQNVSGVNWKNKWLHYKYSIGNGEFKLELSENDNVIYTKTLSLNSALVSATDLVYSFILPYQISSRLVKNIKITSL